MEDQTTKNLYCELRVCSADKNFGSDLPRVNIPHTHFEYLVGNREFNILVIRLIKMCLKSTDLKISGAPTVPP